MSGLKRLIETKRSRDGREFIFRKFFTPQGKRIVKVYAVEGEFTPFLGQYSSITEAYKDLRERGMHIIARPDVAERNIERNKKR